MTNSRAKRFYILSCNLSLNSFHDTAGIRYCPLNGGLLNATEADTNCLMPSCILKNGRVNVTTNGNTATGTTKINIDNTVGISLNISITASTTGKYYSSGQEVIANNQLCGWEMSQATTAADAIDSVSIEVHA